jgi:hypothetical protein
MRGFETAPQDHPLKLQHLSTSSESSMTGFEPVHQDHPINFQQPPTSSESSVTGFEPVEQDSLKLQIDNFQTTELCKMADHYAEPPDFCETHM